MEKDLIYETKVKHVGIFLFKDIYNFVHDFMHDKGYFVKEDSYTEKVKAEGKEIEAKWTCFKKVTDYFAFEIKINLKVSNMIDVEVTKETKKFMANKGELEVKFSGTLVRDYENKFETTPTLKFLRGVYEKYIIRSRVIQMEDKITDDVLDVVNQLKAYLVLEGR